MSASEKLKALDEAALPAPWQAGESRADVHEVIALKFSELRPAGEARVTVRSEYVAETAVLADAMLIATLRSALPQIIAVVEAAENTVRNAQLVADEEVLLDPALAALDEALS